MNDQHDAGGDQRERTLRHHDHKELGQHGNRVGVAWKFSADHVEEDGEGEEDCEGEWNPLTTFWWKKETEEDGGDENNAWSNYIEQVVQGFPHHRDVERHVHVRVRTATVVPDVDLLSCWKNIPFWTVDVLICYEWSFVLDKVNLGRVERPGAELEVAMLYVVRERFHVDLTSAGETCWTLP